MTTIQSVEGAGPVFQLKRHIVLKFDWDAVPGFYGSTINSAVLRMQYAGDFNGVEAHSGIVHNVQADWGRGNGDVQPGWSHGSGARHFGC